MKKKTNIKVSFDDLVTKEYLDAQLERSDIATKHYLDARLEKSELATKEHLEEYLDVRLEEFREEFREEIREDMREQTATILQAVDKVLTRFDKAEKNDAAHTMLHKRITDDLHGHDLRIKKLEVVVN